MQPSEFEVMDKLHADNSQAGLLRVLCLMLFACCAMLAISVIGLIDRNKEIENLKASAASARTEFDAKRGRAIQLRNIGDDTYIVVYVVGDTKGGTVAPDYLVARNIMKIGQIDADGKEVKDDVLIDAHRLQPAISAGYICRKNGCEADPHGRSAADYLN